MIVLGLDPAKTKGNFALSLYGGEGHPRVLDWGNIDPIETVYQAHLEEFRGRVRALVKQTKPDVIAIERFIPRPRMLRGGSAEACNIMIGIVFSVCEDRHLKFMPITASVHKVWRVKYERDWVGLPTEHHLDATSIAAWAWWKLNVRDREKR